MFCIVSVQVEQAPELLQNAPTEFRTMATQGTAFQRIKPRLGTGGFGGGSSSALAKDRTGKDVEDRPFIWAWYG